MPTGDLPQCTCNAPSATWTCAVHRPAPWSTTQWVPATGHPSTTTISQCQKCGWWHTAGNCVTPAMNRLSDADVERIADAVVRKLGGSKP